MSGHRGVCVHQPVAEVSGLGHELVPLHSLGVIHVRAQRNRPNSATLLYVQVWTILINILTVSCAENTV